MAGEVEEGVASPPSGRLDAARAILIEAAPRARDRRVRTIAGVLVLAGPLLGAVAWWAVGAAPPGEHVVGKGTIRRVVAATGKVEGREEVDVGPGTSGRLKEVRVDEGDRVARGDVVAVVENGDLEAAVDLARASLEWAEAKNAEVQAGTRREEIAVAEDEVAWARPELALAEAELERETRLGLEGASSAQQLEAARARRDVAKARIGAAEGRLALLAAGHRDEARHQARAEVKRREAEVRLAEARLELSRVRTPIEGVVVQRYLDPGEMILPERPLPVVRIADTSRKRIRAEVDESDVRHLAPGIDALARSDAFPGEVLRGKVARVGHEMGRKRLFTDDPAERVDAQVLELVIDLEPGTATDRIPLGFVVDVDLAVVERAGVLTVPRRLVREGPAGPEVLVRRGGALAAQAVRLGAADDGDVEVVEGLAEGDVVVEPGPGSRTGGGAP